MQVQEVEILPPLAPEGEHSEPAGGRGGVAMGRRRSTPTAMRTRSTPMVRRSSRRR